MADRLPIGSGSKEAQPYGKRGLQSNIEKLPTYDGNGAPPATAGSGVAAAFIKQLQRDNANLDVPAAVEWASQQIDTWDAYTASVGHESALSLEDWLRSNAGDFLRDQDAKRAERTKAEINDAIDRRDEQTIGSGYQLPSIRRRGQADVDLVTGPVPPHEVDAEEAALNTFRSEVGHVGGLEAWARSELKRYRQYLRSVGAKNSTMSAETWLRMNFRHERGEIR